MRTNVVRALADVVATRLGVILLSSSSMHLLFYQKGFPYNFEFVGPSGVHAHERRAVAGERSGH